MLPTLSNRVRLNFAALLILLAPLPATYPARAQNQAPCEIEDFDVGTSRTDIHVSNADQIIVRLLRKDGQLKKMLRGSVTGQKYSADFGTATLQPGDQVVAVVSRSGANTGECTFMAGAAVAPEKNQGPHEEPQTFDPGEYIRIFEDTGNKRILLYSPKDPEFRSSLLRVDAASTVVVELTKDLMGADIPLNRLFMTATLTRASGNPATKIEVIGYSEIAQSQDDAASQNAVALQTAGGLQATLINMYYTTEDLVRYVYGDDCAEQLASDPRSSCDEQKTNDQIDSRFQLYQPEITAIAEFFSDPQNIALAGLIGVEVFEVEPKSLQGIANQFRQSTDRLLTAQSEEDKGPIRRLLLERLKLIWSDFGFIQKEIQAELRELAREFEAGSGSHCEVAEEYFAAHQEITKEVARQCYITEWRNEIIGELQRLLVPGEIFLAQHDASDGDSLSLRIEAKAQTGQGLGVPAQFQIAVKHLRPKLSISPSLLFIRRIGVSDADETATVNPVSKVNFAPFPGVTCAVTFFNRGLEEVEVGGSGRTAWRTKKGKGRRVLTALAPSIGANVSFMNFAEPRDFDPTAGMPDPETMQPPGQFASTTGSNFQLGAGVVVSLFNNKLQATYGWNLNADRKRAYFGLGFGFVEVGRALGRLITQ